jgi:hypothetical protein
VKPLTPALPPIVKVVLREVAIFGKNNVGDTSLFTGVGAVARVDDSNLPLLPCVPKVKLPVKPLAPVVKVSVAGVQDAAGARVHVCEKDCVARTANTIRVKTFFIN